MSRNFVLAVLFGLCLGCEPAAESNAARAWKERYLRYTELVFNQHNADLAVREYWSEDFTNHNAPPGVPPGAEGVRAQVVAWFAAFPNTHVQVEDLAIDGDRLVARVTITGTHTGSFLGIPPTGRAVRVQEIAWYRFKGDRLTEIWPLIDIAGLLEQLQTQSPTPQDSLPPAPAKTH